MIAAMLIFGSIGIFVKSVDISSGLLAFIRGSVGTLFLLAVNGAAYRAGRKKIHVSEQKTEVARGEGAVCSGEYRAWNAIRKNGLLLLISGAAIGINWICLFEAYRYTTVATATLCYYLAPVFVIAVSPFFLKEKLTLRKVCCVTASLFGMALVAEVWGNGNGGEENIKGILFGVTAAVIYAAVVIMNKHLKEIRAMDMTITQLGAAAIVLIPYVLLTEDLKKGSFDGRTVFLLLFVGIVNTGIAYLLYFSSLAKLNGQTAALFSYIDPVTAIVLSAVFLHEKMSAMQVVGAILILGATLVSERKGTRTE